ncbi:MAG: amidohydrolase family protein [Gemmatimonadota bacterium]
MIPRLSRLPPPAFLFPLLAAACGGPRDAPPTGPPATLAITSVTVVHVADGTEERGRTVLIGGGRILKIGSAWQLKVPPGARVVDGRRRFLIPGLWDMHVHLIHETGTLPLYLANGVTGVRDMGGPPAGLDVRDRVAREELLGPRIVAAGPLVDGSKDAPWRITVETAAQAVAAVDSLTRLGADFIKIHNALPPAAYAALAAAARERGIPFVGHIPRGVTAEQAVDAGQASIEHVTALLETVLPPSATRSLTAFDAAVTSFLADRADPLFTRFAAHGVAFTPTLVAGRGAAYRVDPERRVDQDPRAVYLPRALRDYWNDAFPQVRDASPRVVTGRRLVFEKSLPITAAAQRAAVTLLAGTDVGGRYVFPGFSLHDELELLVRAGLSPLEALRTATVNPVRVLGLADSLGAVRPGYLADLVLLEVDPLDDIRSTSHIAAVVRGGRLLDRAELDRMLTEAMTRAKVAPKAP